MQSSIIKKNLLSNVGNKKILSYFPFTLFCLFSVSLHPFPRWRNWFICVFYLKEEEGSNEPTLAKEKKKRGRIRHMKLVWINLLTKPIFNAKLVKTRGNCCHRLQYHNKAQILSPYASPQIREIWWKDHRIWSQNTGQHSDPSISSCVDMGLSITL